MRSLTFSVLAMTSALALSACREDQTAQAPLQAPPAADSGLIGAPELADLPPAPPAPIVRTAAPDYGWAERAYRVDEAFYQAPPDYGFDYGGAEPWAWESQDDWRLVAEPLSSGYRYYYYEPGADYPYFVRDPDYGYGYDRTGGLAAVYDMGGVLLPRSAYAQRADAAGRYWSRAHALRQAAARERRREVDARQWSLRRVDYERSQAPWLQAAERHPEWSRYRAGRDDGEARRLIAERDRRAAMIARIAHEDRREAAAWRQVDARERADWRRDRAEEARRMADQNRFAAAQERDRSRLERDAERSRAEVERRQAEHRRGEQRQAEFERRRRDDAQRLAQQQAQRQQADQQRRDAERQRGEQRRAEFERRRQEGAQRQQAEQQRRDAERERGQQRQAELRRREDQARQVDQQRRQAEQQRGEQRRAEFERRRQEGAQRQQAEQQRREAERQRGQQRQAQAEQARRQQQARAEQSRHAEQAGRPAAGRERGEPRGRGGGGGGGGDHREGKI